MSGTRGGKSREEVAERIAATEAAMLQHRSAYRVEQVIKRQFKCNERTVRKWMAKVREQWRAASSTVDRADRRNDLDALLNDVIARAMNRTFVVKNDDGTVVVDLNPQSQTFGKPIIKPNPDLQRVLQAVSHLRAIHGVDAPAEQKITVSQDIEAMPDLSKMNPEQITALEGLLKAIAPDGDVMALAGQWFAQEDTPLGPSAPSVAPDASESPEKHEDP